MTAAEFKKKWGRSTAKETASYQEHFADLCRILGQPTPIEADPTGTDLFCYQKRVVKDAELFDFDTPDASDPSERGFADVWKKGCFGWEYKGKKKNLDEAYKQLLRYREALLNPPLLVVCDFDRYIVKTNFNGTVQETYEFTNDQIDRPENWRILRALFEDPEFLKPQRTTNEITKTLAEKVAQVARSLQKRECAELADAQTRAEVTVAQRKNLRIARFLNRLVFCFFAEDTGLLPKNLFSDIAKTALDDPRQFAQALETLFRTMVQGGLFGHHKIRHFNGHLFEDSTVFELNEEERRILVDAAEADWQFVEPSIMGTLFARGLDPDQLAALGAQYTGRDDIVTLVEPVLMAPLRREWAALKSSLLPAFKRGRGTTADRACLGAFLKKLRGIIVMDPACGSGNFLYVSLQMLLDLEKEVITFAVQLGFQFTPEVGVHQLRAIEINPYAYELAQVTVQIGYLQWLRANGFPLDRSPVLQVLEGFHNEDALLLPHYHSKAKTLKEAQAGEHAEDTALKFYSEREWPACDVILSNPPFLGGGMLRRELGDHYVGELFRMFGSRLPNFSDLCCYWFEKAREQITAGKCHRAGLLATQGIRGGANRQVLKRIKESGDIFFAIGDRNWILDGANVHVSLVGFDDGTETQRVLNGSPVGRINANLTGNADATSADTLHANLGLCFMGPSPKAPFHLAKPAALLMIVAGGNVHAKPNSDVLRRVQSGIDLTNQDRGLWTLDFGLMTAEEASKYEAPFKHVVDEIKPVRTSRKSQTNKHWWQFERPRVELRVAVKGLARCLATPEVAKHRVFVWRTAEFLCNQQTLLFARADDYFFGVLHSHFHEAWALAQGTQLRERESGFRYTPTTCFETFPFPFADDLRLPPEPVKPAAKPKRLPAPDRTYAENLAAKNYFMAKEEPPSYGSSPNTPDEHRAAIAAAAQELNELRERWLNPPEWTVEHMLKFPGSKDGPWAHYIDPKTVNANTGVGTVRYPRLEPRDADCATKLKKRTLTTLYNERPAWLDNAHKQLDSAVAAAYGWPTDLTDQQILERLLALNLERAEEEEKAAKVKKPRQSREKNAGEMI